MGLCNRGDRLSTCTTLSPVDGQGGAILALVREKKINYFRRKFAAVKGRRGGDKRNGVGRRGRSEVSSQRQRGWRWNCSGGLTSCEIDDAVYRSLSKSARACRFHRPRV